MSTPRQLLQRPEGCAGGAHHPSQVHRQGFAALCLPVGPGEGVGARHTVPLPKRPGVVHHLQTHEGLVRSSCLDCESAGPWGSAPHSRHTILTERQRDGLLVDLSGCSTASAT